MINNHLSKHRFLLIGIVLAPIIIVGVSSFQLQYSSYHRHRGSEFVRTSNNNKQSRFRHIDGSKKKQSGITNANLFRLHHLHHQRKQQRSSSLAVVLLKASSQEKEEEEEKAFSTMDLLNSMIAKIGATTSTFVAGTFFLVLAYKRDAIMVSFFIGSILNAICSKVLKRIINQSRPTPTTEDDDDDNNNTLLSTTTIVQQPSDNGMPSSHAMSLGFIGTFTSLILASSSSGMYAWMRIPLVVYVIISLIYRIQTKLHTTEQILVGTVLGTFNGYIWYQLCFHNNIGFIITTKTTVIEWVTKYMLNENGVLPFQFLAIPALVGLVVVGSFERKISKFVKVWKEEKKKKQ